MTKISLIIVLTVLIIVGVCTMLMFFVGKKTYKKEKMAIKKTTIVMLSVILTIVLSALIYVGVGSNNVKDKMWDYLKENNYEETDIQSIKVKHSFINIILSYDEWIIDVVYADEPTSVYYYTLKDGNIVESGVTGTTDKEDLKH